MSFLPIVDCLLSLAEERGKLVVGGPQGAKHFNLIAVLRLKIGRASSGHEINIALNGACTQILKLFIYGLRADYYFRKIQQMRIFEQEIAGHII